MFIERMLYAHLSALTHPLIFPGPGPSMPLVLAHSTFRHRSLAENMDIETDEADEADEVDEADEAIDNILE